MTRDPLTTEGLFMEVARVCHGHGVDEVLITATNLIANCIRQNYGLRREAIDKMNELYGKNMEMLMAHYDPVTGRRRSIIPFDQVISPGLVRGKSNGGLA